MNKLYRILFLCGTLFAAAACSETEVDETADLSLDRTTLSANKRGLTYEGGEVRFEVESNVYWVIEVDESVDWLTLSPRAAYGSQTVTVSVDPNEGDSRRTVLHFDSYDGVTAEIEIVQASASELIRYAVTGFGDGKVAEPVAIAEYDAMDWTGVGVASTLASGTECRVAVPPVESSYEGASGGNAVQFGKAEELPAAFVAGPIDQKGDSYFVCCFGVWNPAGAVEKESLKLQISNDGEEFVDLSYECEPATTWTEAVAKFYIPEPDVMYLRIVAPEGYWIDDLHVQEGNEGEGQEVVYSVGGDDGREFGYVYFQDDFSWVTEDYKGTDYIAGWPSNTAETYWNGVTAATHGQTAYDALIASGWTTDDNKLKERVYLRIGYLKMGRAANVAGCGGGVVSPALPIKKNCAATVKVSFDCCACFSTGGTWDPTTTMQVRLIGDGTINDDVATEKIFQMSTSSAVEAIWKSGLPDKNPWERKEFIVRGATASTQIVFESVAETTANRWFFDNVKVEKVKSDAQIDPELVPLAVPVPEADEAAATETSLKFRWEVVEHAAAYEYVYVCTYCGEEVASRSGTTTDPFVEFTELERGTACRVRVRALPAEGDTNYCESEWSEYASAETKRPDAGVVDSHPEGYEFFRDDLSWVTYALFGQADFVGTYPGNPAGVSFANARKLSAAAAEALDASGWTEVAKAYLYEGCIKLGTASAVGSVSSPAMSQIDAGTTANAMVTLGATAFLGTNDFYDDDLVSLSIEGGGSFFDGTTSREFRLGSWNDWVRHSFPVRGITSETKFVFGLRGRPELAGGDGGDRLRLCRGTSRRADCGRGQDVGTPRSSRRTCRQDGRRTRLLQCPYPCQLLQLRCFEERDCAGTLFGVGSVGAARIGGFVGRSLFRRRFLLDLARQRQCVVEDQYRLDQHLLHDRYDGPARYFAQRRICHAQRVGVRCDEQKRLYPSGLYPYQFVEGVGNTHFTRVQCDRRHARRGGLVRCDLLLSVLFEDGRNRPQPDRDVKRQRPDRGCDRRRADPDARPRKCVGGFLVPHCGCRCYHAVALYARFGREEPRAVR